MVRARGAARVVACAGLALAALVPGSVQAEEPIRLAVVPVIVARAARSRFELRVLSEDESFASQGDLSDRVLDCGSDTKCVASALGRLGAPLGIVVVVNLDLASPLLGVQLIDCERARIAAESIGTFDPAAKVELGALVEARANEVLEKAGHPAAARLVLHVRPPEAIVKIEPTTPGRAVESGDPRLAAGAYTLAPGRYRVRAEAQGRDPAVREVELTPGAEVGLEMELEAHATLLSSPWFWIVVGAVAVAGGTTAVLLATKKTERSACVPLDNVDCGL